MLRLRSFKHISLMNNYAALGVDEELAERLLYTQEPGVGTAATEQDVQVIEVSQAARFRPPVL